MNSFLCKLIKGRICQKKFPLLFQVVEIFFGFFFQNSHFIWRVGFWEIIIIIIIIMK